MTPTSFYEAMEPKTVLWLFVSEICFLHSLGLLNFYNFHEKGVDVNHNMRYGSTQQYGDDNKQYCITMKYYIFSYSE